MRTSLVFAVLIGLSARAGAQEDPRAVEHRNDCHRAVETLSTRHPAPKTDWALSIIASCGHEGAMALASAVRSLRASTDTATLDYLHYQAGSFRDADVFAALLEVGGDPAGSVPARVYALLALYEITDPDLRYSYADATTDLDEIGRPRCYGRSQMVTDHRQIAGTPLPSDYESRVYGLIRQIRADSTSPRLVRAASFCTF